MRNPIRAIREPFGTAGLIVAIVALVAALAGGAIAATGGSGGSGDSKATASAKGKPGPRGKTGKTGPAGPAGPAGPQGAAGANGKDGTNGSNGAAGPTGPTGPSGKNGNVGAVGATGETGATGPTGTYGGIALPKGVTETGYWAFHTAGVKSIKNGDDEMVPIGDPEAFAPISFPDRITAPGAYSISFQTDPEFETICGNGAGGAGGTVAAPKAPPQTLCIWAVEVENATYKGTFSNSIRENIEFGFQSINGTGAILVFDTPGEGPASGGGSWALTN